MMRTLPKGSCMYHHMRDRFKECRGFFQFKAIRDFRNVSRNIRLILFEFILFQSCFNKFMESI